MQLTRKARKEAGGFLQWVRGERVLEITSKFLDYMKAVRSRRKVLSKEVRSSALTSVAQLPGNHSTK